MAVTFTNNWENILDKLQSILRVEFGNGLRIYTSIKTISDVNQYLQIRPTSSENVEYHFKSEMREFSCLLEFHYKTKNIKNRELEQVMQITSRIEKVILDNSAMTLSDSSKAYNCRIESTEINQDNPDEYIVNMDFKCVHSNTSDKPDENFVSIWETTSGSESIVLPLISGGSYNFTVDWGDGGSKDTITAYDDSAVTHTYTNAGTYTVEIQGTITGWKFNNGGSKTKIKKILSFGLLNISTNSAFYGCSALEISATNAPIISSTDLTNMFLNCSSITQIGLNCNVSNVTNMTNMFRGSTFNQDIGNWDTSSLANVESMFQSNDAFNQNIGSWDMSNVTTFTNMFYHADAFNNGGSDSIKNWNTSSAANMSQMFRSAVAFNQDISAWNITSLTNATSMLQSANAWSNSYYDALLIAWEGQSEQSNVTFHAGDAVMTTGGAVEAARDALVANGWTITDSTGTHT